MADPKEVVDLSLEDAAETPNEGLETETDASDQDSENPEIGAESESPAEGDGAESPDQVEPRRPSRGEARFQTLNQRAREATERASLAERKASELEQRLSRLEQPKQQGKSPEEVALMTPDELVNYRLGEATKGFEQKLGQIQWATYEAGDKSAFQALVSRDPVAARYADEVESRLSQMRSQGQNVDRERLLTFIVGEKVRQKNSGAKAKQQNEGQRKIARQTVTATNTRGDTPSNRGKMSEQEAREKRLENITF